MNELVTTKINELENKVEALNQTINELIDFDQQNPNKSIAKAIDLFRILRIKTNIQITALKNIL